MALRLTSRAVGPRLRSGQGLGTGAAIGPTGHTSAGAADRLGRPGFAIIVLGLTGFATFVHEIAWTRMFAMILAPRGPVTLQYQAVNISDRCPIFGDLVDARLDAFKSKSV